MYLIKEDLWDVVAEEVPDGMDARDMMRKRTKALSAIVLGVETDQLVLLRDATTGRNAWNILKEHHQQTTVSSQMRCLKCLFQLRLAKGGDMQKHVHKIFELVNELKDKGVNIDDKIVVSFMLASMNEDYEHLVTAIEAWSEDRLVPSIVKGKLIEEWRKKNDSGMLGGAVAFQGAVPKNLCYFCDEPGHFKRDCALLKEKKKNMTENNKESAKSDRYKKWYNRVSFSCTGGDWALDSGASRHMTGDRRLFDELRECGTSDVIVANGDKLSIIGGGTVLLKVIVDNGKLLDVVLEDVLYVPDLKSSLVSVKQLTSKGFGVVFNRDKCFLTKDCDSLLIAEYERGLFRVKCHQEEEASLAARTNSDFCVHEWHLVLAHRHLADVFRMRKEGLRIRSCECSDVCEPCIKGKMSTLPFPKKSTPTSAVMDCVVTDVCGPLSVSSIGHSRYFITFTDLFSKYTEVYFMKTKDETFSRIKQYVEKVKNQLGEKPKILRSDRGREYYNKDVLDYLSSEGINFQCTVGYAPQQNGVSERKNRTLMEGARTLLVDARLGKHFWAEAVRHLNYVFNRLLPNGYEKTPFEMFYGRNPSYDDIHRFGCDVYTMIPYERRKKIDVKAKKMIYVGNDEVSKGYRVADVQTRNISVSRNVKFLDERRIEGRPEVDMEDLSMEVDEDVVNDSDMPETEQPSGAGSVGEEDTPGTEQAVSVGEENTQGTESAREGSVEEPMEVDGEPQAQRSSAEAPRRSTRANFGKTPRYLDDYVLFSATQPGGLYEPKSFDEAMRCSDKAKWMEAMEEELKSIEENGTWELTRLPNGRKAVGSKWVFKLKLDESGNISKYKARLVAQGFSQKFGVDFDEVFAPVAKSSTFRLLLSVSGVMGYTVQHFDVKTAFLNGILEEDIYLKQPPGFERGDEVYKLSKSLYGLRQAARNWNRTLNEIFITNGFRQSNEDKCLYILNHGKDICYVLVHVDDLLIASSSDDLIHDVYGKVSACCELKNLGNVKQYLGIDVHRDSQGHFLISQKSYIDKIICEAGLKDAKTSPMPLDVGYFKNLGNNLLESNEFYRKMIGMLLYLSTNSRPDITSSVAILSQKVSKPSRCDLNELLRVIRYLKGTREMELRLSTEGIVGELYAYSDANWAEDRHDRKSNSGFFVSINGGALGWACRKQQLVSLSTTEAEFVALSETTKELMWLKRLCKEFCVEVEATTSIFTDSQTCMKIIGNDGFSDRTKHIDTKFHYTKDMAEKKEVKLLYCPTEENIADMLTKPLASIKLGKLRRKAHLEVPC